ncbi:PA2778 family cysteine peptidase [Aliidiomarina soli]|uniref:Peptidase C39-like domain-containing protein n=1 Tax=Aliidiomarina soli TaxID=1928574 RepID=A0A432WGI9_9GAMM|nr:PA2778 family cysteine peptidase [Aliidiomarina soli]RUO32946.1 hypothetical protein CWE14_06775 [Aliidiomarina soli]
MFRNFAVRAPMRLLVLFGALLLSACAAGPLQYDELVESNQYTTPVELLDTPFHPQEAYQCGPAALATILQVSGVDDATPERLADQVYLPERQGSLQMELLGATRRASRVPYVMAPTLDALMTEVYAGNPVLVLQNLGLPRWPMWHYAVVIGYDPEDQQVVLRSGTTEREIMSLRRFERTWKMADYWALVVTEPGVLPESAEPLRYFEAVAPLEQQQRWDVAIEAYQAAAEAWPGEATSFIGLGNIAYQQQRYGDAEFNYYQAIEINPEQAATYFNLAWALVRQAKFNAARSAANEAAQLAADDERMQQAPALIEQAIEDTQG